MFENNKGYPTMNIKNCSLFIVNIDLVGYSTKTEPEQCEFAEEFHKKVKEIISSLSIQKPIIIPTGDGIFLGYENVDPKLDYLKAIDFIFEINKWAKGKKWKFRSAINFGSTNILEKDINGNKNIFGNLINDTSRIISAGDKDAVIMHKDYYDKFIRDKRSIGKYSVKNVDSGTVLDKHHYTHICYSVTIGDGLMSIGNKKKLKLNYMTQICASDMPKPKNLKKKFPQKLKNATKVIFYGIYNPTTAESVKKINCSGNGKIDITVVYAADNLKDEIKRFFGSDAGKLDPSNKQKSIEAIKEYCSGNRNISLHLKEYTEMPTFGASLLDSDTSGKGFMHISNYLQGIIPDDTPYFELEYLTEKKPFLYEFYLDFFNNILPKLNDIP